MMPVQPPTGAPVQAPPSRQPVTIDAVMALLRDGMTRRFRVNDGLGQGNNIAVFPRRSKARARSSISGTSKNYRNKTLRAAIETWLGGNWVQSYPNFLIARVPGLTGSTRIDEAFLASPKGIQFMKAQAWHEAGKPYPMTDDEWQVAQRQVFASKAPVSVTTKKFATAVATNTATATAAAQAHSSGASITTVLVILGIGIGIVASAIVWYVIHKRFLQWTGRI